MNGLNAWKSTGEKLGGVGRSTVFDLWTSGALASVKIGTCRLASDQQIQDYIARLEAGAA